MPLDKFPLVVKEFKGKLVTDIDFIQGFSIPYAQSEVPFDYALESINLEYLKKGGIRTRNGIENYIDQNPVIGKPLQFWKIDNLNGVSQVDRWLILTWDGTDGRLYDTGVVIPATNPILTLASMKYAFVINAFGKMYITPWSAWITPLTTNFVYVYNGLYNVRLAKASAPIVGAFAVAVAAGGNVTPGLHYVSVLYETDTGYISICPTAHLLTPLGATTTAVNATINGSNVPLGPANSGVIKRHIIITKVVVNANGQGLKGYEPFIALTIPDNTTTTFSFTSPDSALVETAKDYIEDVVTIPACISLAVYGNRLVYVGPRPSIIEDSVLISPSNRPEQINTSLTPLTGGNFSINDVSTIFIGPDFSGKPVVAAELNKVLYIFKTDSTFSVVADNELDPSEWEDPTCVDGGKGAFPFGIAKIGNNAGSSQDGAILVAGNHGITYFSGQFAQNSISEAIWDEFAVSDLKWIKLVVEPIRKIIITKIGDPNNDNLSKPANSRFLPIANYYYGLDITTIRWGRFTYDEAIILADIDLRTPGTSGSIGPAGDFTALYSLITILHRVSVGGANYNARLLSESTNIGDFQAGGVTTKPSWVYITGYTPNKAGEVYTFGPLKLRVVGRTTSLTGTADLSIQVGELDGALIGPITTITVPLSPKKYYSINLNARGEKIYLKLSGASRIFIQELILHAKESALDRPRV